MRTKGNFLKVITLALIVVFLIAAALIVVKNWEDRHNYFPSATTENGFLSFEGKDYVLDDNIETFLIMGLDRFDGATSADSHESGIQADFLMLFVFDNAKEQCKAIQINRDTMVTVNKLGIGGTKVDSFTKQIALAYNYVADNNDKVRGRNTKDSVEDLLYGIKVNHYMSLTMDAVAAMNDLVGGVEVTVLDDFTGIDDTLVCGENVTLTGEQALRYVRTRYGLEDSTNNTRMARQQQYINALYEKTISQVKADDQFVIDLATTMNEYVAYDSSNQKMQKLTEKFKEYEFLGIEEIKGESKKGEEFMEFYPDKDKLLELVIDEFYKLKEK